MHCPFERMVLSDLLCCRRFFWQSFVLTIRPQIQDVAKQMQENNPAMFEALRQQASQLQQEAGITEQQQQQEGVGDKNPEDDNPQE